MEIVSKDAQRTKYRQGVTDAVSRIRMDEDDVTGLPIDEGRYTARELGLLLSDKSWSGGCDIAANNNNYQDAMNEVTEVYSVDEDLWPFGEPTGPKTLWQTGVALTSNASWVNAVQSRGVANYRNAMTTVEPGETYPRAIQSYSAAMGSVRDWLTNISLHPGYRTRSFDAAEQINRNIRNVEAVALGLHAQSRGQALPGVATGNGVPCKCPDVASLRSLYDAAFEEYGAIQRYDDRFTEDGVFESVPEWRDTTLSKWRNWSTLADEVGRLSSRWEAGVGAVGEEEFIAHATSNGARTRYRTAFQGDNLQAATEAYMAGYAPYRNALARVELPPPGPPGSDINMRRAEHVAGLMLNTRYTGYGGAPHIDEFTFYGEGPIAAFGDWLEDIYDQFPWI